MTTRRVRPVIDRALAALSAGRRLLFALRLAVGMRLDAYDRFHVACDFCPARTTPDQPTRREAAAQARRWGWVVAGDAGSEDDVCPACLAGAARASDATAGP